MDDLTDELAALARQVRAVAADAQRAGVRTVALPAPEAPDGGAEAAAPLVEVTDTPAATPDAAPAAAPRRAGWDAVAQRSRAERAPAHHDDGQGAEGLAAIRADLGDCTRCGLCEGRTELVFGVGDPVADLMVLGEGPGAEEDQRGEPFVGPAGQMLDRMLANVLGLPRPQVYIANVVKCRPPDNRKPTPAEAATCLPFLRRQIQAVQPKMLLVLGSTALEHVLGMRGITRNRGQEVAWNGIPAMPTFHPAYLLRKPQDKRLVFEDLKRVKARYDQLGGRRR